LFVSFQGRYYSKLRLKGVVGDVEAGEKFAVAFPFEITMKLAFSLHHFVQNYRQKPTWRFALQIQRNSSYSLQHPPLYKGVTGHTPRVHYSQQLQLAKRSDGIKAKGSEQYMDESS